VTGKQKRTLLKELRETKEMIRDWKRHQMGQWHDSQMQVNLWWLRKESIKEELAERFGEECNG
jgi:hypothetical protein